MPLSGRVTLASYTHKLNLEWDTAFLAFQWLPVDNMWRNVEIEGSLEYVATGLPRLGDLVDVDRFLTDDSPWSFSIVICVPTGPARSMVCRKEDGVPL